MNWASWLGIENDKVQMKQESSCVVDANDDESHELNKPDVVAESEKSVRQFLQKANGLRGFVYDFASSASKKLSESVIERAQTLKKSVEEGNIHGIINKTILGDFQKEQEKFVQEQKAKNIGTAVPPWVGLNEEDTIQQQILSLSVDKRNFLRDPPAGVQFQFDFEQMYPVAMVMLEEDELLQKMRFHLVPKQVKEEAFWKNYFYRVSLIKQSAQITALAAQQAAEQRDVEKNDSSQKDIHLKDAVKRKSPTANTRSKSKLTENEDEISTSPGVSEFVSDSFDSWKINKDELRKEMEQLVLGEKEHPETQDEETEDWERELQAELQEYDVLADNDNTDENWDKEIEEMLKVT